MVSLPRSSKYRQHFSFSFPVLPPLALLPVNPPSLPTGHLLAHLPYVGKPLTSFTQGPSPVAHSSTSTGVGWYCSQTRTPLCKQFHKHIGKEGKKKMVGGNCSCKSTVTGHNAHLIPHSAWCLMWKGTTTGKLSFYLVHKDCYTCSWASWTILWLCLWFTILIAAIVYVSFAKVDTSSLQTLLFPNFS